jgi:hypothetical protein
MPAMTMNAADPKQVERARIKEAFNDRQFAVDLRTLLDQPAGRRILWWLLEIAGIYRRSFTGNSETFFNEGKRDIGLTLLAKISEVKPEAIILMMQESKKREEANDDRSS